MFNKVILSLVLIGATSTAVANHNVGATVGFGGIDYKGISKSTNGFSVTGINYGYDINKKFDLVVGYNSAKSADTDVSFDIDDFKFNYFYTGIKYNNYLTTQQYIYSQIAVTKYEYEIDMKDEPAIKDHGIGFTAELGWAYEFKNNLTTKVSIQHVDMDKMSTQTLALTLTYQF